MTSQIKTRIKDILYTFFPGPSAQLFAVRARAYSQALARSWGCIALNDKVVSQFGNKVLHGPFSGIELSAEARREHISPFLLGTYEQELHDTWNSIFEMKFSEILDVGAKFGFYAVGLARRLPGTPVLAFDTDPWARKATKEMSSVNKVAVQTFGLCSPEWMLNNLKENSFVFSDCEGYEATLFGSIEVPNLSSATMLIEIHEQFSPGVTEKINSIYSQTHEIKNIPTRSISVDSLLELDSFSEEERKLAVNEFRSAQQSWMFLRPLRW